MSKRYAEPIEVEAPDGAIEAFWWRGKRYGVREVLGRWREAGGWWSSDAGEKPWQSGQEHEILRIHAQPMTNGLAAGIYEIARDLRRGTWTLYRVLD